MKGSIYHNGEPSAGQLRTKWPVSLEGSYQDLIKALSVLVLGNFLPFLNLFVAFLAVICVLLPSSMRPTGRLATHYASCVPLPQESPAGLRPSKSMWYLSKAGGTGRVPC